MLIIFLANILCAFLIFLNTNKLNGIFISATYFELVTLRELYKKAKIMFSVLILVYITAFVLFVKTYFTSYVTTVKPFHDNGAIEVMKSLKRFDNRKINGDNIMYIYNLYANPISPYEFNETKVFNGLTVTGYKNYDGTEIDVNNCDLDTVYVTTDENKAKIMIKKYGFEVEVFKSQFYILYK